MAEGLRTRLVDLDDDSDVVGSSLDRTQIAAMWCADPFSSTLRAVLLAVIDVCHEHVGLARLVQV